jgi:hypothetical protein
MSSLEFVETKVVVTAAIAISDPAKIRSLFFIAIKFKIKLAKKVLIQNNAVIIRIFFYKQNFLIRF